MTTMLRPILPLLMLIPLIAIAGTAHAATSADISVRTKPALSRPHAAAPKVRTERPTLPRIFAFADRECVRSGNRMVC